MLINDFYTAKEINTGTGSMTATVFFNAAHKIFEGHFPGQPVVPGVCMVQLVRELIAMTVKEDILLVKAVDLKFLKVIDPRENQDIKFQAQYNTTPEGSIMVSANLAREDGVCFKFKGSFQIMR